MNKKKKFTEPEVVRHEESLDKITLCVSGSQGDNNDYDWKPKNHHRRWRRHH